MASISEVAKQEESSALQDRSDTLRSQNVSTKTTCSPEVLNPFLYAKVAASSQKNIWNVPSRNRSPVLPNIAPKHTREVKGVGAYTVPAPGALKLNKFVRRLHDMLLEERYGGVVQWRKGLLVLHNTDAFAKEILPKHFNTSNFKTFRRQLNYYGFVHVRSFSATGATTTALWVNQELARKGAESISSVLLLKRVNPCPDAKTTEGRRVRKEEAFLSIEDLGISADLIPFVHNLSRAEQSNGDISYTDSAPGNLCQNQFNESVGNSSADLSSTSCDVAAHLLLLLSRSMPIVT